MYIIAGLGNPGRQYAGTRHNMGFNVVTRIADDYKMQITIKEHKSAVCKRIYRREEGTSCTASDIHEFKRRKHTRAC